MEEKKPFMPPPPKGLKTPSQQAGEGTAKTQSKQQTEVKASPSVEKAAPVSAPENKKPVAQAQPQTTEKQEQTPKKEKKNLLAPMAFIFWGAVALVLIVLFIILKDKI